MENSKPESKPRLEPVSLQAEVISELHKTIGMRIDFHTTFNHDDNGEALRKKLRMGRSAFDRLKRGKREISLTDLKILSEFFNTTVINIIKINF